MARLPLALEAYKPPNQASSPLVLCVAASSKVAGSRAESSAPAGDATLANWQISHRRFRSGFRSFSGYGFFVTETAIFLTLRVCGLRAGLTSNPGRAEPVIIDLQLSND